MANKMRNLTAVWGIDLGLTPDVDDRKEAAWSQAERGIKDRLPDVVLAGPEGVTRASVDLSSMATELLIDLKTYRQVSEEGNDRLQSEMRRQLLIKSKAFDAGLTAFMLIAQQALDDDGSQK
ncbi:hypothetical protein [Streptomyces sp. WAC 04229]|uniref:hypothetical protein n=1 Tax=Streptomyces sp. WAC 04229 TaxID=2203206 RepID=UPI003D72C3A0